MSKRQVRRHTNAIIGPLKPRVNTKKKLLARPLRDSYLWKEHHVACASPETAPLFEESIGKDAEAQQTRRRAERLCLECPMIYHCFEQTLLDKDRGQMRAGIAPSVLGQVESEIGASILNAIGGLPQQDPLREEFFERSKALLGVLLKEVPIAEAIEQVALVGNHTID